MGAAKQAVAARPTASLLRASPRLLHPCAPMCRTFFCHIMGTKCKLWRSCTKGDNGDVCSAQ